MHRLRLICNGRDGRLRDQRNSQPPAAFNGDALQVECFLEAARHESFDLDTIASLYLLVAESAGAANLFPPPVVSSFNPCAWDDWADDDGYHALFSLTNGNMTVGDVESIWMAVIARLTDGSQYTFAAGELLIFQGGILDNTAEISSFTYDGVGRVNFTAGGVVYEVIVVEAGTPGTEGTITVDVAGLATLTLNGIALQFSALADGSGSADGTVTVASSGLTAFTSDGTNYQFTASVAS